MTSAGKLHGEPSATSDNRSEPDQSNDLQVVSVTENSTSADSSSRVSFVFKSSRYIGGTGQSVSTSLDLVPHVSPYHLIPRLSEEQLSRHGKGAASLDHPAPMQPLSPTLKHHSNPSSRADVSSYHHSGGAILPIMYIPPVEWLLVPAVTEPFSGLKGAHNVPSLPSSTGQNTTSISFSTMNQNGRHQRRLSMTEVFSHSTGGLAPRPSMHRRRSSDTAVTLLPLLPPTYERTCRMEQVPRYAPETLSGTDVEAIC